MKEEKEEEEEEEKRNEKPDSTASTEAKATETTTTKKTTETETTTSSAENTLEATRSFLLLKCSPTVARFFKNLDHSNNVSSFGPLAAKLTVSIDPLQGISSPSQWTMELAGKDIFTIPRLYNINMSLIEPLFVFSESSQGKPSVEGEIRRKLVTQPSYDSIESYGKWTQKTQMKKQTNKRSRMDIRKLERKLFELFERQQNWKLKQLMQETNQPKLYLKSVLKRLCDYNFRSLKFRTYSLKPEHRPVKVNKDNEAQKEKKDTN